MSLRGPKRRPPRAVHIPTDQGAALCGQRDRTGTVPIPVSRETPLDCVTCGKCLRVRRRDDTAERYAAQRAEAR